MGIAVCFAIQLEQIPQVCRIEMAFGIDIIYHAVLQGFLVSLSLENLLFDGPGAKEAVNVALFPLAVAPHTSHSLIIIGRVPVGIKHDKPVSSNKVQTATTRFAAKHEDEIIAFKTVETLHDLSTFFYGHSSVQANIPISANMPKYIYTIQTTPEVSPFAAFEPLTAI